MKYEYVTPKAELILLESEEVLAASGTNPLIDPAKNQSGSDAENFGIGIPLW